MTTPPIPSDLEQITAGDVMRSSVLTVEVDAPLAEAARLLSEHGIGGAPVTDEAGHICGVVSIRDILERYAEAPPERAEWRPGFYGGGEDEDFHAGVDTELPETEGDAVRDVMTAQVHSIGVGANLREVAARMAELGIHRILVEDRGRHVGLISSMDILRAVAGH